MPELFNHTVTASKDSWLGAKVSATCFADQCCPYFGDLGWDTSIRYSSALSRLLCLSAIRMGSTLLPGNLSCLSQPKGKVSRFSCKIWIEEGAAMTAARKAPREKRVERMISRSCWTKPEGWRFLRVSRPLYAQGLGMQDRLQPLYPL